jgi:hypothetical protein
MYIIVMTIVFVFGWQSYNKDNHAAVMEYQQGSYMCKTIQLTGISMFIIII